MKTTTILKTLALALLMPTMLLTTACSNSDDIANTEKPANTKGYALPVTVNVTRQGDDATRATYDESTKKFSFSTGDKLFVMGNYNDFECQFAGSLTWQSGGTFSGTILTQTEYSGTAAELLASANSCDAVLMPAGYDSYDYLSIVNEGTYDAWVQTNNYSKTFALTKKDAVEQFSCEYAGEYSNGFALAPKNAIVSFTISGLAANTEVPVCFNYLKNDDYDIPGTVTTNAEGVATFAVGVIKNMYSNEYSLTVDGNNIALPAGKTFEAGHIYNISRSLAPAGPTYPVALSEVTADYLGSVVTTDGNVYATVDDATAASKTAAAVIAYVSSTGHGLAIALADESSKASGMTMSMKINNMSHTPAVSGQTWKLPKEDEWKQMFSANGGSDSSYSGLNTAITNAGGSALQESDYWVAHNTMTAVTLMTLSGGNASFSSGAVFNSYYVRVGFAF